RRGHDPLHTARCRARIPRGRGRGHAVRGDPHIRPGRRARRGVERPRARHRLARARSGAERTRSHQPPAAMAGPPVVLVTGGDGQVGRALRSLLPSARYAARDELDVTDRARTNDAIAGVDVVVHLAAMTDVDRCEREPHLAEEVNGAGSRNLAEAASATGARVIGVSSDYVFDGTAPGEYTEADQPRPLSVYGRTKLAGEQALLEAGDNTVVRTSWVYGDGRNFIRTILRAAAAGRALAVVDDQLRRATGPDDLSQRDEAPPAV